jgi:hypothetical protein
MQHVNTWRVERQDRMLRWHDVREELVPKREKSKRLQVVISEEQDSLLTKTAYQLSNPERLISKSEVVRLGIAMLNRAVESGQIDPELLKSLDDG